MTSFQSQAWAQDTRMQGISEQNRGFESLGQGIARGVAALEEGRRYRDQRALQERRQTMAEKAQEFEMLRAGQAMEQERLNNEVERNLRGLQTQEIGRRLEISRAIDETAMSKEQARALKLQNDLTEKQIQKIDESETAEERARREQLNRFMGMLDTGEAMLDIGYEPTPEGPPKQLTDDRRKELRAAVDRNKAIGEIGSLSDRMSRDYPDQAQEMLEIMLRIRSGKLTTEEATAEVARVRESMQKLDEDQAPSETSKPDPIIEAADQSFERAIEPVYKGQFIFDRASRMPKMKEKYRRAYPILLDQFRQAATRQEANVDPVEAMNRKLRSLPPGVLEQIIEEALRR